MTRFFPRLLGAVLALLAFGGFSHGLTFTLNDVLDKMERKEKTLQGLKFDFRQQTQFFDVAKPTWVEGTALFAKPHKFHIEKKVPDSQRTVSDGKKIWIYAPEHEQVWEGLAKNWAPSSEVLKGLRVWGDLVADLKNNFLLHISTAEGLNDSTLLIKARPKDPTLGYNLELTVSRESWFPVQTLYQSESANVMTTLTNIEFNPSFSEKIFRFVPPKGTEVVPLN